MAKRLIKITTYSRPHNFENNFTLSMYSSAKRATIYPLITSDEGQGNSFSYNSNPRHASFAERDGGHCYPGAKVNKLFTQTILSLTKLCVQTDKIYTARVYIFPIYFAFTKDYTAKDELSGETTPASLEMQSEDVDNQGYPIYNGTDCTGGDLNLDADQLGLTTDVKIEYITPQMSTLYQRLQYASNKEHLKTVIGRGKWYTITRDKPVIINSSYVNSKVKAINEKTFCGEYIFMPTPGEAGNLNLGGDATDLAGGHVLVHKFTKYNEWFEDKFDSTRT